MFERFKGILGGAPPRPPKDQLKEIEAELARCWSYSAYDKLRSLAGDGNPEAQFRLGQMFDRAEGVVQNLADAVHWYTLAAERGFAPAQARLGLIYFIDPPEAASLYPEELERVESTGTWSHEMSRDMLRKSFPNGFNISKDYAEAAKWNLMAAEQGVAEAQARYGQQLALGLGVDRNAPEAERWFSASAAQADSAAQLGLGILYAGGFGGPSDYQRAIEGRRIEQLNSALLAGSRAAQAGF